MSAPSYTLDQIKAWCGGRWANESSFKKKPDGVKISRISSLEESREGSVAFFFQKGYAAKLAESKPSILITAEPFLEPLEKLAPALWANTAIISCADPYGAMAEISARFEECPTREKTEIHPTTVIHPTAEIGKGTYIGPFCVIEEGVKIGDGNELVSHVFIGKKCQLGSGNILFSNVSLYPNVKIGSKTRIHSACVIGADGFGYAPKIENGIPVAHRKIHHLGGVEIGDDVEIGAGSCIDRGTFSDTRIDRGAKIDNLVQIGHNCWVEEGAVLCGNVGMAGSSRVGRFVYVGGGTGIGNQVHVGDFAKIAAYTLVTKNVKAGEAMAGNPMKPHREYNRFQAKLKKLTQSGGETNDDS